jgi:four helix bundle protein
VNKKLLKDNSLQNRTKKLALAIIAFVDILPDNPFTRVAKYQLIKAGTSVGANYRAACRARSKADFIAKMGIVEEEADETLYWLELLVDSGTTSKDSVIHLISEADEILAMVVSSINTARKKR